MSESNGKVISLGSILIDLRAHVEMLPLRGSDVIGTDASVVVGGGFNLLAAAARQGAQCTYAGPYGAGPYGSMVLAALQAEGVNVALEPRTDDDTGFCLVLIEPDAERTFVTVPGVEACQRYEALTAVEVGAQDLVAVSGYDLGYPVSGPILERWICELPDGCLVLDTGPLIEEIPSSRLTAVLRRLAVLSVNRREAQLLAGSCEPDCVALAAQLRERLPLPDSAVVIVRAAAAGCAACGGELGAEARRFRVPHVDAVDSTGAGDTHTGVLIARLLAGDNLGHAISLANRAAAISVTRLGSATAPSRAELAAVS